jgi:thiamine pyrophosphokinase
MKTLNVLVGGPVTDWPEPLKNGTISGDWVAADRGALRLLRLGITPILTVGDFDSLTDEEKDDVLQRLPEVVSVKPEKDETDTELLLRLVNEKYHPDQINIYGATGGRLDHLLSNLWIFSQPRFRELATKVQIIDRTNVVRFFLPGNHELTKLPEMQYLGFMNLTPVSGLTLVDEKYRLTNWASDVPFSFSSNEFDGQTNHFQFDTGMMMVIQSRDLSGQAAD